jgi:hypothetical protein
VAEPIRGNTGDPPVVKIYRDALIIVSKHHGETHIAVIPIAKLITHKGVIPNAQEGSQQG